MQEETPARHLPTILTDALIICVALTAILLSIWVYRAQYRAAWEENATFARDNAKSVLFALSDHTEHLLDYCDNNVRTIRQEYLTHGNGTALKTYLKTVQIPHASDISGNLVIADEKGTVFYRTGTDTSVHGNLSGTPYFKYFRNNQEETLYLDPTRTGILSDRPQFRLIRPIIQNGKFHGVVLQSISVTHFTHLFESYHIGAHGFMAIIGLDHHLIARHPQTPQNYADKSTGVNDLWPYLINAPSGKYDTKNTDDGQTRHVFYAVSRNYPLVIAVGISDADIDNDISQTRRLLDIQLAIFIISSVIACILILILLRQNRRIAENERHIRYLADTDALTGAKSRRTFLAMADKEFSRARRYNQSLSVIMIDADNFKNINDTYGHHTGDIVLQKLAEITAGTLRQSDIFGRIGGEEFAVLLPQTTADKATAVAERIRLSIMKHVIGTVKSPVRFTISAGVSTRREATEDFAALLNDADRALYSAKNKGRNCIAVSEAEITEEPNRN